MILESADCEFESQGKQLYFCGGNGIIPRAEGRGYFAKDAHFSVESILLEIQKCDSGWL